MKHSLYTQQSRWLLLVLIVIIIDQITKYVICSYLLPYEPQRILAMLNLTLGYNTGAAFSFLSQSGAWHHWFFMGFGFLMSSVLSVWLLHLAPILRLQAMGISLILGGGIGNLLDRVRLGHVIDFIDLHYANYHWPIFNIADSAICLGAILLFFGLHRKESRFL